MSVSYYYKRVANCETDNSEYFFLRHKHTNNEALKLILHFMRLPFVIGFIIIATHRSYVTFTHTHSHPTTSLFPTLHYDV